MAWPTEPKRCCGTCRWLDLSEIGAVEDDMLYHCAYPLPDTSPLSIYPWSVTSHPDFLIRLPRKTVEPHEGAPCLTWEQREEEEA